jgi:hypothetical protein
MRTKPPGIKPSLNRARPRSKEVTAWARFKRSLGGSLMHSRYDWLRSLGAGWLRG